MINQKLIDKPEVKELLQKLSDDKSPAKDTYKEIISILDEITDKLNKIDLTLERMLEGDPNTLTPQKTCCMSPENCTSPGRCCMSPGSCPIS